MTPPDTIRPAELRDVVRVWYVRLDASMPALRAGASAILSGAEHARAARVRVERARREFVIARMLLRTMLAAHTGVAPAAWDFAAGPNGKPAVVTPREHADLAFSISHTRGLVACALTAGRPVGVDVESLDHPRLDVAGMAARYFHPRETAGLDALASGDRDRRFFELWTLKESYLKARDLRLATVLRHAAFTIAADGAVTAAFDAALGDDPAAWAFAVHAPTARHTAAVTAGCRIAPAARVEWHDAHADVEALVG